MWDELLTAEIARILGCVGPAVEQREQRLDARHDRLFKAFLGGGFEGTLNAVADRPIIFNPTLRRFTCFVYALLLAKTVDQAILDSVAVVETSAPSR